MKAILYKSNTGYTKKYAQMLSEVIQVPAFELEEAKEIEKGSDIIYMGWVMAGSIKGYKKAAKNYNVKAICMVGMGDMKGTQAKEFADKNQITQIPVFYLQGGFDIEKLHGIFRIMMNTMKKSILSKLEQKTDRTPEEDQTLQMMKQGADFVKAENLAQVQEWYQTQ